MEFEEPETFMLTANEIRALAIIAYEHDYTTAADPATLVSRLHSELYESALVGSVNGMVRVIVQLGDEGDRFDSVSMDIYPAVWRFIVIREALSK